MLKVSFLTSNERTDWLQTVYIHADSTKEEVLEIYQRELLPKYNMYQSKKLFGAKTRTVAK